MHSLTRSLGLIAATASLLYATSAMAGTPRRPPPHRPLPGARVPTLQWVPCAVQTPGVQCAQAMVPLDYNNPDGPQITLSLARVQARRPAQRIGTLFLNPGGPGGQAVSLIKDGFTTQISPEVLDRFDIVGWDPRGVGESTPLLCWASDAARNSYFAPSLYLPWRADQEPTFFNHRSAIRGLCAARGQAILGHMSTAEVARDLDLLRQAVGDPRLNYIGYSYGSYLGATYANLFPMQVRAMVLDSVVEPAAYASARMFEWNHDSADMVLQQFFLQCELAGAQCPLNGNGGPALRYARIAQALRNGASTTYNHPDYGPTLYTYDFFLTDVDDAMKAPESWKTLANTMVALDGALSKRSAPAMQPVRRAGTGRTFLPASRGWSDVSPGNYEEAFLSSHCSDARYPPTLADFQQRAQIGIAGTGLGQVWAWEVASCAGWPASPLRYMGPWNLGRSAPILTINARHDAATPIRGAVEASRLLANSRLLTYEGWGHAIAYTNRSACVSEAASRYLIDGTLPAEGATCPAAGNPFASAKRSSNRSLDLVRRLSGVRGPQRR